MSRSRSRANIRSLSPQVEEEAEYKQLSEDLKLFAQRAAAFAKHDDSEFNQLALKLDAPENLDDKSEALEKIEALISQYSSQSKDAASLLSSLQDLTGKVSILITARIADGQEPPLKKRRRGTITEIGQDYDNESIMTETGDAKPVNSTPVLGSQVAFRLRKYKGGEEEWIQCDVTKVFAEASRYEVQDPEPDENNNPGQTYRASVKDLIVIQPANVPVSLLNTFPPGSIVLARYPETTTFYKAEVTGIKRDGFKYRLRFEGEEEEGKETEVERRLVLAVPK